MISFCPHCWAELDDSVRVCPRCGADLSVDSRSYEDKMLNALNHPLPEARLRACWLLGSNAVERAAEKLMERAKEDEDIFVRHAAVHALGNLHSSEIPVFLQALQEGDDQRMKAEALDSLRRFHEKTPGM